MAPRLDLRPEPGSTLRIVRNGTELGAHEVSQRIIDVNSRACYDLSVAPTIFRRGAFRFFFFSREEPRRHVHVSHTDGEAKFWLEPRIELAMNQGLSPKQVNEALSLVQHHYEEISNAWNIHFGS